ncbi:hypothetical protein [Coxiella burnetii]|uniref:hypothetical protein n=1 Tax=Coxiella burnetii TaxID=777 RepID=UPI000B95B609|nr:hypothetical protein [Coxiella burnetii]ATN66707.1 hypothetical protein AYM17_04655 [Coxiella burnetii]OYK86033.1 hypothetical protein CbuQ229_04865 [Coxiella burnetii]
MTNPTFFANNSTNTTSSEDSFITDIGQVVAFFLFFVGGVISFLLGVRRCEEDFRERHHRRRRPRPEIEEKTDEETDQEESEMNDDNDEKENCTSLTL